MVLVILAESSVVAENSHLHQLPELRPVFQVLLRSVRCSVALGWFEFHPFVRNPKMADRHPVFRERSGLVRQDHGCRPEDLDGRQAFDQSILSRHPPHAAGKRQRGDHRKPFRNSGDSKGNGAVDHQKYVFALQDAGSGNKGGQDERRPDQLPGQLRQAFFKRRVVRHSFFGELRDAAEFSSRSDCDDNPGSAAPGDESALEQHGGAIGDRCIGCHRLM